MPTPLDPMTDLQNRWYKHLAGRLFADPSAAQLIQPSPLVKQNSVLWSYENQIPPASLTFNTELANSPHFFDEYTAVIQALELPEGVFERDIGTSVFQQWKAYIRHIQPPPTPDQLPGLFFDWAVINAPNVANIGQADLHLMITIDAAQEALRAYQGPLAKPVDFAGEFQDLVDTLERVGTTQFRFESSKVSGDVSQTWTHGVNTNFYGLWARSNTTSALTLKFARSEVIVDVNFRYAVWLSIPGPWYSSFDLNVAFSNNTAPPWPPTGPPRWDEFFGPQGSMQRLIGSLLVADQLNVAVESDVSYSDLDQLMIAENSVNGLWPLFVPDDGGSAHNAVTFDRSGSLRVETSTARGMPIVIGANVLGIARYLGG